MRFQATKMSPNMDTGRTRLPASPFILILFPKDTLQIRHDHYCRSDVTGCIANLHAIVSDGRNIDWIVFKSLTFLPTVSCLAFSNKKDAQESVPWICIDVSSREAEAKGYIGQYRAMSMKEAVGEDGKTYKNQNYNQAYQQDVIRKKGVVFRSSDVHKDIANGQFNVYLDQVYIYAFSHLDHGLETRMGMSKPFQLFTPPKSETSSSTPPADGEKTSEKPNVSMSARPGSKASKDGVMAAIIVMGILLLFLLVALIVFLIRYRKRKAATNEKGFSPNDPEYHHFSISTMPSSPVTINESTIGRRHGRTTTAPNSTIGTIDNSNTRNDKTIK